MRQTTFVGEYGVRYPLVLAGMAMISDAVLTAAVSNAGALGLLGTGPMDPSHLRRLIREVRARTDRPFGIDFIVETTGLGPATTDDHVDVALEERVSPVVFFWNPPPVRWLERLRRRDVKIWMTVTTVDEADGAMRLGADAMIVQGREAGGHNRSQASTITLVRAIRQRLPQERLVAAGGIADGRAAAAALAMGADAVCMGTRYLASRESPANDRYKDAVIAARSEDTTTTTIFGPEWPDVPMRVIRNRAVLEAERRSHGVSTGAAAPPIGSTRLFDMDYVMPEHSAVLPTRETRGHIDRMCLAAGTSVEQVDRVQTVDEITRQVVSELREALRTAVAACPEATSERYRS